MKTGNDAALNLKLAKKLRAQDKEAPLRAAQDDDRKREEDESTAQAPADEGLEVAAAGDSVAQAPPPPSGVPAPREAPGGIVPPSLPPGENQPVAVGPDAKGGAVPQWLITGGLIAGGVGLILALDGGSDGGGGGGEDPSGTMSPVIDTPSKETTTVVSIDENTTGATTVKASDGDSSSLTYSLSGGEDKALFKIDERSGVVSFIAAPDFETPRDAGKDNDYAISVKASDGRNSDTIAITVRVKDLTEDARNDAPTITSNEGGATAAIGFVENASVEAPLTTVKASDPDPDTVLTFSLVDAGDDDSFTIDAKSGELRFKASPDIEAPKDTNGDNKYLVTVKAADADGAFDTQLITVTVSNDNEAPVIVSDGGGATATLNFDEGVTRPVTTVQASDPEKAALTYSIVVEDAEGDPVGDGALFAINPSTGVLGFKQPPDFESPLDRGGDNRYEVTVKASDGTGSDTQAITVRVIDGPDFASLSALSAAADENLVVVSDKGEVFDLGMSTGSQPPANAGESLVSAPGEVDLRSFIEAGFGSG